MGWSYLIKGQRDVLGKERSTLDRSTWTSGTGMIEKEVHSRDVDPGFLLLLLLALLHEAAPTATAPVHLRFSPYVAALLTGPEFLRLMSTRKSQQGIVRCALAMGP
jgi:hypothetical protein